MNIRWSVPDTAHGTWSVESGGYLALVFHQGSTGEWIYEITDARTCNVVSSGTENSALSAMETAQAALEILPNRETSPPPGWDAQSASLRDRCADLNLTSSDAYVMAGALMVSDPRLLSAILDQLEALRMAMKT